MGFAMIYISHRGNTNGKNPARENTKSYIDEAIAKGFDVEIDICKWDGKNFYLGHDEPQEAVSPAWLEGRPLWIHAKDHVAFHELIDRNLHCFWHNTDRYTLTSNGWIWAYPGEPGGKRAITVFPEKNKNWKQFSGICSDNIESYKNENL